MTGVDPLEAGRPELTVVIVSFRCHDLLADCLASLALHRNDVDLEVDVIDSASGDNTIEAAVSFPWVRGEALSANIGFSAANNRGIARARGRAILILNPDTVVPEGALRSCLDQLWARPDVGLMSPRLVTPTGEFDRRCKRGFPTPWSSFCYFTGLDRVFRGTSSLRYTAGWLGEHEAGEVEVISGAFMLARAEALAEVGGFDEHLPMYAEDLDLSLRFPKAGWKVLYWPGVDVVHVGGGSGENGRRTDQANAAYFRAWGPFLRKHMESRRGVLLGGVAQVAGELALAGSRVMRRVGLLRRTPPR